MDISWDKFNTVLEMQTMGMEHDTMCCGKHKKCACAHVRGWWRDTKWSPKVIRNSLMNIHKMELMVFSIEHMNKWSTWIHIIKKNFKAIETKEGSFTPPQDCRKNDGADTCSKFNIIVSCFFLTSQTPWPFIYSFANIPRSCRADSAYHAS